MTTWVVAAMSAREVGRRRAAAALVVTLPLWFYLGRRDHTGQSIRMLTLGVGWSVSTLTLFLMNGTRGVDPRLRLTGASVASIVGGRLLAMTGGGALLALAYAALAVADQRPRHCWAVVAMAVVTAVIAAPLGSALAALLPRELEGALGLFSVVAVQMLANPDGATAKYLPFWSARELGNYAVDGGSTDLVWRGLTHASVVWTLCLAATWGLSAWRLRVIRYPKPHQQPPGRTP